MSNFHTQDITEQEYKENKEYFLKNIFPNKEIADKLVLSFTDDSGGTTERSVVAVDLKNELFRNEELIDEFLDFHKMDGEYTAEEITEKLFELGEMYASAVADYY